MGFVSYLNEGTNLLAYSPGTAQAQRRPSAKQQSHDGEPLPRNPLAKGPLPQN